MENPVRERFLGFLDVIMRVPPIFFIDEMLRIGLGLPNENIVLENSENGFKMSNVQDTLGSSMASATIDSFLTLFVTDPLEYGQVAYKMHLVILLKFLCCCIGKASFYVL